ncbi:hypothetical protein KJ570_01895 [Patescibacteria group bacterium]|nr:hypothetical protein [Patescibacteria group bacterium]MBU2036580.1 hypothetical protein [Patescibacteria group bacterium]
MKERSQRTIFKKFEKDKIGYINPLHIEIEEDSKDRKIVHPHTPVTFQDTAKSNLPIIKRRVSSSKDIKVFNIKIGEKTYYTTSLEVVKSKFDELKGISSCNTTDGLKPHWPEVKFVKKLLP